MDCPNATAGIMVEPINTRFLIPQNLGAFLLRLICVCGLATLAPLFGSLHWILQLFENVPLQLTAALLVLLLTCLFTKKKKLAIACGVLLLPNLYHASYYFLPRFYPDEEASLRITTFNVLKENDRHGEVLEFLDSTDSDVIAVVEVNDAWLNSLSPLNETHPHTARVPNTKQPSGPYVRSGKNSASIPEFYAICRGPKYAPAKHRITPQSP